jgi:ABC-2 type transport system ATP-binding protein
VGHFCIEPNPLFCQAQIMSAITIKNLKKHFGKVKAVDGISFEIEKGEIFGFLGPNGAGKTTTIRCMMDFIRPDAGTATILDLDAQENSVELKSKLGYLAPEPRLYDEWTGKEHIDLINGIRGGEDSAGKLIERLGADVNTKTKNLSTGNRRKISLILALMHDPELVIMDEPTAGLDPLLKHITYEILGEMSAEGKTIFMSSHDLSEVEKICTRAAIIREGKLVGVENIGKLNAKRLYRVWVKLDPEKELMRLAKIPSVEVESETPSEATFAVAGNIDPVIKFLAKTKIDDVKIEHAGLEETFMKFYEKGEDK